MGAVLHGPGDGERIAAGSGSEILMGPIASRYDFELA
jgi:hypothetical protein